MAMSRKGKIIYIALFLALCLIPSAGLLAGGWEDSAENEDRAAPPALHLADGGLNVRFLADTGDWFEENFAWRREMVTLNAKLQAGLLWVSAENGVILGSDGWLYYRDSLNDYTGRDQLSDRALYDIAHTARLTQDYCSYFDADYLFVIAPDKATLYPEHMPYYYAHRVSDTSNRIRLHAFLEQEGVHFLDLTDVLEDEVRRRKTSPEADDLTDILYHKRDSHWTAEGAAMAAEAILDALGMEHRQYEEADASIQRIFEGDLEKMLFPAAVTPEEEVVYDPAPDYAYVGDVGSTFDPLIQTVSEGAGVSLLMYRDSFGNALLPFLAESFSQACFSRSVPYDILFDMNLYAPTAVVEENAERNLPDVASRAPVLQGIASGLTPDAEGLEEVPVMAQFEEEASNPYFTRITGIPGEEPLPGEQFLIDPGDGSLYEAMPVHLPESGEEAFVIYLPAEQFPAGGDLEDTVRAWRMTPSGASG